MDFGAYTTTNLLQIIVITFLLIAFLFFVLRENRNRHFRTDAREAKKSDDTLTDPNILDTDQQAADLQVGQQEETRRPNRFEPDKSYS